MAGNLMQEDSRRGIHERPGPDNGNPVLRPTEDFHTGLPVSFVQAIQTRENPEGGKILDIWIS